MANKTVCIHCDAQGNYSVGEIPMESAETEQEPQAQPEAEAGGDMGAMGGGGAGGEEMGEMAQAMQPAKDLEDALQQARTLLAEGEGGEGGQSPEELFQSGYNATNAGRTAMEPKPGAGG